MISLKLNPTTVVTPESIARHTVQQFFSYEGTDKRDALTIDSLKAGWSVFVPFRVSGPKWFGPDLVAKVLTDPKHRKKLREETQAAAIAAKVGVAPPVHARDADLLLTSFVKARDLPNDDLDADAKVLGVMAVLARLHQATRAPECPQKPAVSMQARVRAQIAYANRLGLLTSDESKFIVCEVQKSAQGLAAMNRPQVLTHGDFQHRNILLDEADRVWLIDFEDTGMGEAMTDLAHLTTEVKTPFMALPRFAKLWCQTTNGAYTETLRALELCHHAYALWRVLIDMRCGAEESNLQRQFQEARDRAAVLWA
jgi:thiamine kinase-like enzyme